METVVLPKQSHDMVEKTFLVSIENYSIYRGTNGFNYYISAKHEGQLIKFKHFSTEPLYITKYFNQKFQITTKKEPVITNFRNQETKQYQVETIAPVAFENQPVINKHLM